MSHSKGLYFSSGPYPLEGSIRRGDQNVERKQKRVYVRPLESLRRYGLRSVDCSTSAAQARASSSGKFVRKFLLQGINRQLAIRGASVQCCISCFKFCLCSLRMPRLICYVIQFKCTGSLFYNLSLSLPCRKSNIRLDQ